MQLGLYNVNKLNYSSLLIPKEQKHSACNCNNPVGFLLFFAALTMFATGHLSSMIEQPIGAKSSTYYGAVSETAFQFFKDNKPRQGKWGTCTANGDCGYYGIVNAADIPDIHKRWQPPETVQGGMVILMQSDNGKGQKFKYFSPANTWKKSKDKQEGVVTVLGFFRDHHHSYGLSREALESLINLEDIYHSPGWRALLEPLLPEGLSMPEMEVFPWMLVPPVQPMEPLSQAESSNTASQESLESAQEVTTRRRRRKSSIIDTSASPSSQSSPSLPSDVDAHQIAAESTQLLQQDEVEPFPEEAHRIAAEATRLVQQPEIEALPEEAHPNTAVTVENEAVEEKRERRRRRRVPGASSVPASNPSDSEPRQEALPSDIAGGNLQNEIVEGKKERRRRRRVPDSSSSLQTDIVPESTSTSCHISIGTNQFDIPLTPSTTFQYLLNHYIAQKGVNIGDGTAIEIIDQAGQKKSHLWGTIKSMPVLQLSPQVKQLKF